MTEQEKLDDLKKGENGTPAKDDSHGNQDPILAAEEKVTRYKEQMEGDKKDALRYRKMALDSEVQKAQQDKSSLLELHTKDPSLANEVAKVFKFYSFEDAKANDFGHKANPNTSDQSVKPNEGLSEDQMENWYQKRQAKDEHTVAIVEADKVISSIDDEELRKQAKIQFDTIVGERILTKTEAVKIAEMATLYVNKDRLKDDMLSDGIRNLSNTNASNSKKPNTGDKPHTILRDGKIVDLNALNSNKQI